MSKGGKICQTDTHNAISHAFDEFFLFHHRARLKKVVCINKENPFFPLVVHHSLSPKGLSVLNQRLTTKVMIIDYHPTLIC